MQSPLKDGVELFCIDTYYNCVSYSPENRHNQALVTKNLRDNNMASPWDHTTSNVAGYSLAK